MELFRIGGPNPDTNYLFMGTAADPLFALKLLTFLVDRRLR
jgi:hypothetical protein